MEPSFTPIARQIGEFKWYYAAAYLSENSELAECMVSEHESGWRYMLYKTNDKNVFTRKTYYGTRLTEERPWNIVLEAYPGLPY